MAYAAMPERAATATRRVFLGAGVVAASAPDIDLIYTGLAESPIGYLLHHRGHSHTMPGLVVIGAMLMLALWAVPGVRASLAGAWQRCAWLVGVALVSHLLMDAGNNYGTLLLYPFSTRWVYGDAIFILEPSLWVMLGIPLIFNAHRRWPRLVIAVLVCLPCLTLVYLGLISTATLVALGSMAGALAWSLRMSATRVRAGVALAATLGVFVVLVGLSQVARAEARRAISASGDTHVIDIVLDANPSAPWCWSILTLERPADGPDHEWLARRGTLSLLPSVLPVSTCASYRILTGTVAAAAASTPAVAWHQRWDVDARMVRTLYASDCRVRAWLSFGRIPFVTADAILDLRYENPVGANFSLTPLHPSHAVCPEYVPLWTPPRADVLGSH